MSNNPSSSSSYNHDEQRRVQEDGPEYRSVMMRPLVPPPMPLSFGPLPTKLSKPAVGSHILSKASASTASSSPSFPPSQTWKVVEPVSLPAGYLLERTNVYVDAATPQVVADRVCESLRMLSIAASTSSSLHDSEDDENVLYAETQDCVKFAVRLFSDQGMVVVEIQRQSGCSFSFREASRAVLRSAKGMQPFAPKKRFTIPSALPERSIDVQQKCVRDDFEIAYSMLRSERSDSQVLALESLEQLTRSCAALDVAAKAVLSCDCLKQLLALLEPNNSNNFMQADGNESPVLKRKVLAVVANACAALSQADLAEILSSSQYLKTRTFLSMLLSSMRDASKAPHDAYHAVRCLQSLLICKEVEDIMMEMSATEVVESARNTGCDSHQALEMESQKLMVQLRNVC